MAGLLLLAAPLIAACAGLENTPDGWAAPLEIELPDESEVLIVRIDRDRVAAVDSSSGRTIWEFPGSFSGLVDDVEAKGFYGTPTLLSDSDELLIADHDEGIVYAVRTDGTSARAVFDTEDRIIAGVVVDGGRAYVSSREGRVYAIDLENPPAERDAALWTWAGAEDELWGTAALAESAEGTLLLVPSLDGNIYALRTEPEAGDEQRVAWTFDTAGAIGSNIVVDSDLGLAYVGSFDGRFYALDVENGDEVWVGRGSGWFWTTPLVSEGVVYVADLEGKLWAWNADNGLSVWDAPYDVGDPVRARVLLVEDGETLVIFTRGKQVHAVRRTTGELIWRSIDFAIEDGRLLPNRVLADPVLLPDGRIVVSDDRWRLWDIEIGQDIFATEILVVPLPGTE